MAESGLVVVPTPSSQIKEEQHDDETTVDELSMNQANSPTSSPLKRMHETNQQYSSSNSNEHHISNHDNLQTTKLVAAIKSESGEIIQSDPGKLSGDQIIFEDSQNDDAPTTCTDGCGSSQQLNANKNPKDPTSIVPPKKKNKCEETIIDGFAICAFKSWEDLQDDVNEKIALIKATKGNTASEKSSSDKIIKKKRARPKSGQEKTTKPSSDKSGSFSQTRISKAAKKDKKVSVHKVAKDKSLSGLSVKPVTKTSHKRPKDGNKGPGGDKQAPDKSSVSSLPRKETVSMAQPFDNNVNDNQISAGGSATNHQSSPHRSQSPKVHQSHDNDARENKAQDRILNRDVSRDPLDQSRATVYSSYGNSPHAQRSMYDSTSSSSYPIKISPHQRQPHDQTKIGSGINQNSHPQQVDPKQTAPQHAISSSPTHPVQSQMPYHQNPPSTMYPPPHHQQGTNHQMPHYAHPMQQRPPNPYFNSPVNSGSQTPTNQQQQQPPPPPPPQPPPSSSSSMPCQYQVHSPYNYHHSYLPPGQPPYYPHDGRNGHMTHPFHMYPPPQHPSYPQQSSSVVSSMRMSSFPAPYGTPYIITDTTISKQTSIVPSSVPAAFQHAAASSMASRFGHHPSTVPPMSHYSPAAPTQPYCQPPPPLYPKHSAAGPAEKSLFELARSYSGVTGTSSTNPSNFLSFPNSGSSTAPPTSYASHMYNLNRWPRMAIDHQQAGTRYSGLYPTGTASLLDRGNPLGSYAGRVPPYSAGMFPPPPF